MGGPGCPAGRGDLRRERGDHLVISPEERGKDGERPREGPGRGDPPVTDAEGKDCNEFHGDYTGLAVGPDDSVHVVWTGLNRLEQSPQVDPYTGGLHDGYAQDAMYARR